ncbi:hypothetical protein ACHAXT_008302 [Thalassiosira profunda]
MDAPTSSICLRESVDPPGYGEVEDMQAVDTDAPLEMKEKGERGLDPRCDQETSSSSDGGAASKGEAMVPYDHEPVDSEDAIEESPEISRDDKLAYKSQPTKASTEPSTDASEELRSGFDHCYVTVPRKDRLSVLFATLRRSRARKAIVVCSTCESAAFHAVLFQQLEMMHVYEMHEEDTNLASSFDEFYGVYPGILFASEMSLREFDVPPDVDYVIQYEPPTNPSEYIYRMSKAKIYQTSCHKALLFLSPEETRFLAYFDHIPHNELEGRRVAEFALKVQKLLAKHGELNDSAWKAFRAFAAAYEGHTFDDIYDPEKLDEEGTLRSFGQPHVPEYSSKRYFVYNRRDTTGKGVQDDLDDGHEEVHPHEKWMNRKEMTWRRGYKSKPWMDKESRTWKRTKKLETGW